MNEPRPRRILVVDDKAEILDITRTVLTSAGHEVETVLSGQQALERVQTERFDLVLLDINMPEVDGWEVLRVIRADLRLADLPVVMFSVKGELHDKVQGMQEGALDYITKPFIVDDLIQRVERIFETVGRTAS